MATPRAVAKRSGSSNGKWFFTGVLQIRETIPLQILDPFVRLFEVRHTRPAAWSVEAARVRHLDTQEGPQGLTERGSWQLGRWADAALCPAPVIGDRAAAP